MTLGQDHDTPLSHGQLLCEILSRSNISVRSYGPDTEFGYMCTVTLTLEIWPWLKVMTWPWVMDNNCVKYYPDQTWQWGVVAWTQIFGMWALWPWRYDLGSRSWHTLGSWKISVWNIIQIPLYNDELWPVDRFSVYAHCDPDLGDMTLCQGHDTPLVHGQQLCELLTRSNFAVRSCGPDTDFGYVWPWPWRYDLRSNLWHTLGSWTIILWNIIQIEQVGTELWPGQEVDRWTDRQTGWFLYTPPPNFVSGGIINYQVIEQHRNKLLICLPCLLVTIKTMSCIRPKKINCVFPLTCSGKIRVGLSV